MKRGDFVTIRFCGHVLPGMVLLASPNGRSLMLGFDGGLIDRFGNSFVGSIPVLQDDAGTYRVLINDQPIEIEPKQ